MKEIHKKIPITSAKEKIYRYCAYQERTHQDVKDKLYSYGLTTDEVEMLTTQLITDGYLNEERFARTFAGGKFRIKSWGRIKIVHELEARGITKNCIQSALKEIDEKEYLTTLHALLTKKVKLLDDTDKFVLRDKLAGFAIQRGFEPDLVWSTIKELVK